MALSIRNSRAEELARKTAGYTGQTMTDAIIEALEQRLAKLEAQPTMKAELAEVMNISRRCAALPTLDARPDEEILGYHSIGS